MPAKLARRTPETVVFTAATGVALLHALDDAFLGRQPGVGFMQHALGALVALLGAVGAVSLFPRVRPSARAAFALLFGSLALVNGALHIKHLGAESMAASDLTGVLAAVAGGALVLLAAYIPFRHRGAGATSTRRRWAYRVLAVPATLVGLLMIVMMGVALTETHKFRTPIGAAPSGDYREVAFKADDGVKLSGWYRPTRNGATVIVLHGGGGDRTGAVAHARMLARHGYGVLLYDARGRGRSEGTQNSFGWGWGHDVTGAVAFLKTRPEVDPRRIGGLGLSTGADVLVEAAGQHDDLRAVVGDGTAAGSFEDWRRLQGITGFTPFLAAEFATVRLTSGAKSGPPLEEMVRHGHAPLLLVSGGRDVEYDFNVHYDAVAGDRDVEHWNLPQAGHTGGLHAAPRQYEQRVTAFFAANLG
ncbi:alpha/beta hydrolase [Solirubrobacter ginsenosidimutans]|uniref:Alpha/beta hydrolase n=1 Tax=Solirubrobacter ginsenosidimutans TaxID=490573 RepID=A0A9X3S6X5_9ACTN|nr:CocE/NonD family hydrolase [Solirubrobacter ginsenosidimutans]MDA0162988.1 alpha/beta hydrolase [Solirubrobacter ginsenosidimutans]